MVTDNSQDVRDNQADQPRQGRRIDLGTVRAGHGTSAFQAFMTVGAFAALDRVPPRDPRDPGAARWPARFGHVVDAYAAQQVGDDDAVRRSLAQAGLKLPGPTANVGDAIVAALGVEEVDEELFDGLFSWSPTATLATYRTLPLVLKPIWILDLLCCALGYRRNVFGRFLPAHGGPPPTEADLEALAEQMNEAFETPARDSTVPAGFVFFGQFVDHDITFDTSTRLSDLAIDPDTITNVRTPALDLDSVYADGPEGSPEIYDEHRGHGYLLVGPGGKDLARNHVERALIGDPRNDENTIVSQLHLAFLHYHNAILRMIKNTPVDALWGRDPGIEPNDDAGDFEFARRMARWHYQWVIVHDWLPRIIEPTTLQAAHAIAGVPQPGGVPATPAGFGAAEAFFSQFQSLNCCGQTVCRPLIPVEFSAAAFRFAHSQIRSRYTLNADRQAVPLFVPSPAGLASFGPVPEQDLIDWAHFFDLDPTIDPQKARMIDTWLSAQVFQLPFAPDEPNLAFRNLRRGSRVFAIPPGGQVAATLGVAALSSMGPAAVAKLTDIGMAANDTPLWFYVLGEAEAHGGQLGPVGGLLVAVTLLRLLQCDEDSYVHSPGWQPVLVPSDPGTFTMADLVRIATHERLDENPT